jgi:flavin-dependent dehydrogenase
VTKPEPAARRHDVIIAGGGLAGLTLALQLRQRLPQLDILVLERRAHPVPEAAFKVGESSVEIGGHYFQHVLGLEPHLVQCQLKKFGFRFFFSEGADDIASVTELGASRPLPVPSWQIDRGIFENFLGEEVQRRGVHFVDQATVRRMTLADSAGGAPDGPPGDHTVTWQRPGEAPQVASARWLIDASGRAGLLKRQLKLGRDNAHGAHAVWFRIGGRIRIDDWSDDPAWRARCVTPTRWLSTNHLVGAGYWVWLIPLASGSHSVGIVADPRWHPIERMDTFERAMDWFAEHQPLLFRELDGRRDELQDFAFFRRFSYDCTQVLSPARWALAGEAGRFLDPFYSPGSDFIAMTNTYIAELIERDLAGKAIAAHAKVYDELLRSFYDSTLQLYVDQYGLFGDPEVLPLKVLWDYTYYWSVLAPMFFQQRLADLRAFSRNKAELATCQRLNAAMQGFLRDWGAVSQRRNPPRLLDQAALPWFVELNRSLASNPPDDDAAWRARLLAASARLRRLAGELIERGLAEHPGLNADALRAELQACGGAPVGGEPLLFAPLPAAPAGADDTAGRVTATPAAASPAVLPA